MLQRLKDVFASFDRHEVRYVVIGGIAAVLYGVPRATFDLDILIDPTRDNADRLLRALSEAGLATASMTTADEVIANEITVFSDRVRIDVQTRTPGLAFDDAWAHHVVEQFQDQPFRLVAKSDLIAAKRAAGRAIDLEDVRQLESES
jgi:hypothetical protein